MAAPSFDDLYNAFKAELVDRRSDLTVLEGDISEMYAYGGGAMADALLAYFARLFKETFLDGAEGDALTTLSDDHWNVQRTPATYATDTITFSRASSANGAGTIDTGSIVATAKDAQGREVQFATQADVSYGASETGDKTVAVQAVLSGVDGNVAAGKITKVISTLWDDTITVTNSGAAGGNPEESDADLRDRVRNLPQTIARGTLAALEYGAKQTGGAGVVKATALEDAGGIVTVYVSDSTGASSTPMINSVHAELENWRAAGVIVNVAGGAVFSLTGVSISLTVRAGVDTQAIAAKVKQAIVAAVDKLKIGETLYRTLIQSAARGVDPDGILEVLVNSPAANVTPGSTYLVKTTVGDITIA